MIQSEIVFAEVFADMWPPPDILQMKSPASYIEQQKINTPLRRPNIFVAHETLQFLKKYALRTLCGPLLFLIFINDSFTKLKPCNLFFVGDLKNVSWTPLSNSDLSQIKCIKV